MKKILALVLATLMVLTAVSALAEKDTTMPGKSKTAPFISNVESELEMTKVVPAPAALQAIIDAIVAAGPDGAAAYLATLAEIPEGFTKLTEAQDCYQITGDTTDAGDQEFIFHFGTPFGEGQEVLLLIGIAPAEGDVEWLMLNGKGNADGDVVVTITGEQIQKIANNPFLVIPVTAEEAAE